MVQVATMRWSPHCDSRSDPRGWAQTIERQFQKSQRTVGGQVTALRSDATNGDQCDHKIVNVDVVANCADMATHVKNLLQQNR